MIFARKIVLWKKVIEKTLIFAGKIVLWEKVIEKTLIFTDQNILWKKIIQKTLFFACQIFLWKKVIEKTLIFTDQNILWKKVIKKTLIFACQIVFWKKVIEKTLTFASSRVIWIVIQQNLNKNHVAVQVHIKDSFTENYQRNFDPKWVIDSESTSFEIWRKKSILLLWKKILFLSITNFSPDFYQLARLAEQNNSFLCKIFDQFFTYTICI